MKESSIRSTSWYEIISTEMQQRWSKQRTGNSNQPATKPVAESRGADAADATSQPAASAIIATHGHTASRCGRRRRLVQHFQPSLHVHKEVMQLPAPAVKRDIEQQQELCQRQRSIQTPPRACGHTTSAVLPSIAQDNHASLNMQPNQRLVSDERPPAINRPYVMLYSMMIDVESPLDLCRLFPFVHLCNRRRYEHASLSRCQENAHDHSSAGSRIPCVDSDQPALHLQTMASCA